MAVEKKCTGGGASLLEVEGTGASKCKCIKSAKFNNDGTLTITFTDGSTVTSGSLTGATGAAGATGPMASNLIHSDPDDHVTTNTTMQSLSSFITDHTNALKTLVNKGDNLELYMAFQLVNDPPNSTGIQVQFLVDGVGITNNIISFQVTVNSSEYLIECYATLTLKDDTAGNQIVAVSAGGKIWKDKLNLSVSRETKVIFVDMGAAGTDFGANNYTIAAQAKSKAGGDIVLKNFTIKKNSLI